MNITEQKVAGVLNKFPKLKEIFIDLISNPEQKLDLIKGVTVLKSNQVDLRLKALDKCIEIRFNIVSIDCRSTPLGQIAAYLIKSRDDEFISENFVLSIWFDQLGNICSPEPTTRTLESINDSDALLNYVSNVVGKIVDSEECQPIKND